MFFGLSRLIDGIQISKIDMDRLVMQYLVTEGYKVCVSIRHISNPTAFSSDSVYYQEAAEQFEKDTNIHPEVELSTIGGLD